MGDKRPRPVITDVAAVRVPSATPTATKPYDYVISRSYAETVDLISEGPIEGIVSGSFLYEGLKNRTGYQEVTSEVYVATGTLGNQDSTAAAKQRKDLGFLRSIYWNEVPLVDKDGFYNFSDVNLQYVKGDPIGHIPQLEASNMGADQVMDLSVARSIGDRLYGPEIDNSEGVRPGSTRRARLKAGTKIDKYAKTYSILNKECTQIDVNIRIPGLFENLQHGKATYKKSKYLKACRKRAAGKGDTKASTIVYWIYYRPIFDERFGVTTGKDKNSGVKNLLEWTGPIVENVTGKIDSPYIRTTKIDLSQYNFQDEDGFQGWSIRIARVTSESLTSFIQNKSFVDSIVEVYGNKLRYPYSSMVYSRFDAANFSRIPARAYDTRLLKVKVPNNYDPISRTYGRSDAGTDAQKMGRTHTYDATTYKETWTSVDVTNGSFWDGEFKKHANGEFNLQWTNNPAWCFYDLLTNPRYGLGEYIDEDQVDKWALYDIAQYCDTLVDDGYGGVEPQFTINYIITSREEAFKVMNDLASIFRGITYYSNGSIFAIQDKFKEPIFQFNNSNVLNGNFNYSSSAKRARHTVAIVRYNDKRNLYQPAVEYVEDEDAVRRYGIREIETTALGCTSRGQARRFAEWILASEAQETETVTFSAGQDGAYLNPGDVVQIYDNYRNPLKYSGRTNAVRPITGTGAVGTLTLDEIKTGYTNGTYSNVALTGGSGTNLTANITVSTPAGAKGTALTVKNITFDSQVVYEDGTYENIYIIVESDPTTSLLGTVTVSGSSISIALTDGGENLEVDDGLFITGSSLPAGAVTLNGVPTSYGGDIRFQVATISTNVISSIAVNNQGAGYLVGEVVTAGANQLGTGSPSTKFRISSIVEIKLSPSSDFDSEAYNSVILDQTLDFNNGEIYKFSLLTPTYNYPADTTDLSSTEANELSRSALQTLYFRGQDTRTITGDYRSDFTESGSGIYPGGGVCTEIYFNSGLNKNGTVLGTGNQLDFNNYVITGYVNEEVQLKANKSEMAVEYSGGCFSGENLIWSVEPSSDSKDFISGSFENYRVINVQENEQGYNISALFYSTGKYDNIISSTTLEGTSTLLPPSFPTGSVTSTRQLGGNTPLGNYEGALSASQSTAVAETVDNNWERDTSIAPPTIEVEFFQAGYGLPSNEIQDGRLVSSTIEADNRIGYIICVHYTNGAGPVFKNSTQAPEGLTQLTQDPQMVIVDASLFESHYKNNVVQIIAGGSSLNSYISNDKVHGEIFIDGDQIDQDKKNIYVTVFAQSPEGLLSDGIMKAFTVDNDKLNFLSIVQEVSVSALKTEGQTAKETPTDLDAMEPAFQWELTLPKDYYTNIPDAENPNIGEDNKPHIQLYPGLSSINYRITIRRYDEADASNQNISDTIYLEVTGYAAETITPSFIFNSLYNDPDTVTSLLADNTYKVFNEQGNQVNDNALKQDPNNYIQVPESGFNIIADPNIFPIRTFDIVVEAHDIKGNTSAGNRVGQNTILGRSSTDTEVWGQGVSTERFESFSANILSPSGVFFAQTQGTLGQEEKSIIISTQRAYDNNYPYIAKARPTSDGNLHFSFRPSTNFLGEERLPQDQIEDIFENVRGLVYYCTTGDNSTTFEVDPATNEKKIKYLNPAPNFSLNENMIKPFGFTAGNPPTLDESQNSGNFGLVGWTGNNFFGLEPAVGETGPNKYTNSIIRPEVSDTEGYNNFRVIRGSYVLKEDDSLEGFIMPFPVIGDFNVTNVQMIVGFFDELSLEACFEDDEITPKVKEISNENLFKNYPDATVSSRKIFADSSINFSTLPQNEDAKFQLGVQKGASVGAQAENLYFKNFAMPEGTPMFLGESSILTAEDSANSFRGWCEISLFIDTNNNYKGTFPFGANSGNNSFTKKKNVAKTKVHSDWYNITLQPNDYFNAEGVTIYAKKYYKDRSVDRNKIMTLSYEFTFTEDHSTEFGLDYSVLLSIADVKTLRNPTLILKRGFMAGLAAADTAKEETQAVPMVRVSKKTNKGFIIELDTRLTLGAGFASKPLSNFFTIKFGLLVKS